MMVTVVYRERRRPPPYPRVSSSRGDGLRKKTQGQPSRPLAHGARERQERGSAKRHQGTTLRSSADLERARTRLPHMQPPLRAVHHPHPQARRRLALPPLRQHAHRPSSTHRRPKGRQRHPRPRQPALPHLRQAIRPTAHRDQHQRRPRPLPLPQKAQRSSSEVVTHRHGGQTTTAAPASKGCHARQTHSATPIPVRSSGQGEFTRKSGYLTPTLRGRGERYPRSVPEPGRAANPSLPNMSGDTVIEAPQAPETKRQG